jgi:hypothetical protein
MIDVRGFNDADVETTKEMGESARCFFSRCPSMTHVARAARGHWVPGAAQTL